MGQSYCGKGKKQIEKEERSEQFYCLAKIHYPEMVGDEGCDEQCVRCKLKGQ